MNRYFLYNEMLSMSYGPFKILCRNYYVSTKRLQLFPQDLGCMDSISVIDPNGAVIVTGARVIVSKKGNGRQERTHVKLFKGTT